MRFTAILLFLSVFLLGSIAVRADEPLPPPADYEKYSANHKFKAVFDAEDKTTIVYRVEKNGKKEKNTKLWEMAGWYRNTYLSNDGKNLVVVYDGANLLNLDYKTDEVMISFYGEGNLINQIHLDQLLENPEPKNLEKTVSHYKWVQSYGLNQKELFEVNTPEKKQFLFSLETGLPVNEQLFASQKKMETGNENSINEQVDNKNQNTVSGNTENQNAAPENVNKGNCQMAFLIVVGCSFLANRFTHFKNSNS